MGGDAFGVVAAVARGRARCRGSVAQALPAGVIAFSMEPMRGAGRKTVRRGGSGVEASPRHVSALVEASRLRGAAWCGDVLPAGLIDQLPAAWAHRPVALQQQLPSAVEPRRG